MSKIRIKRRLRRGRRKRKKQMPIKLIIPPTCHVPSRWSKIIEPRSECAVCSEKKRSNPNFTKNVHATTNGIRRVFSPGCPLVVLSTWKRWVRIDVWLGDIRPIKFRLYYVVRNEITSCLCSRCPSVSRVHCEHNALSVQTEDKVSISMWSLSVDNTPKRTQWHNQDLTRRAG